MPVDCHVHFFTRSLLSDRAGRWLTLFRAASLAENLVHREERGGSTDPGTLVEALDSGLKENSLESLQYMDRAYGGEWCYVPLMVDLEYALAQADTALPEGETDEAWSEPLRHFQWENEREYQLRRRIWQRAERTWKTLSGDSLEIGASRMLAENSFELQKQDLTALKVAFPERVFPFLGVDPRRQHLGGMNLVNLVGDYVGPGKPFTGVKLYSAAGFSPTDPALYSSRGLYHHCRRRGIPITVHFASGGFASPLEAVRIRGDVYHPLYARPVSAEDAYPGGLVEFEQKMTPGNIGRAVAERQMLLNHPLLWEKVLERWPGLIINFAHAGGDSDAMAWMARPGGGDWMSWAFRQAARRRGVYVDMSAYAADPPSLEKLAAALHRRRPGLRHKILYGSDYFLSFVKDPSPRDFLFRQEQAFGCWWRALTVRNPRRFLAGGSGSRRIG